MLQQPALPSLDIAQLRIVHAMICGNAAPLGGAAAAKRPLAQAACPAVSSAGEGGRRRGAGR